MSLFRPKRKRLILFLCTGDTCRGPMAVGFMRKVLEEKGIKDVEVKSAGVMTATGLVPTPEVIQLLEAVQVDARRHRSSKLTTDLLERADLVLGMTPFHVQFALRMAENAREKVHLFKEFTRSDPKNYQITDPMGHTLEVFKRVFREIRLACECLAALPIVTGKPAGTVPKKAETVAAPARPKKPTRAATKATEAKAVTKPSAPKTGSKTVSRPAGQKASAK